ncbi:Dimethyl sulfoxide reductase DmsA [Halioglobus japonicus]|nr:Dimethyl sulfoxide reductase DmsA [Halioglobus japonicus]
MGIRSEKTYCRICEASCGLVVDIETDDSGGETIRKITADADHPISKGYACIKGTSLAGIHHDPDRVNFPLKRVMGRQDNDCWEEISWAQAIDEIATKARGLKLNYGANTLAHYAGNPTYANFKSILCVQDFIACLGSNQHYASHSVDLNNKFQVAADMFGVDVLHPIPDFDHMEFFMCLGGNPVISQMSVVSVINPLEKLQAIEARGGKVVIVDPRRTETASKVGEHVFIHPGTDAFFLLALLYVLHYELEFSAPSMEKYIEGADALVNAAKEWTPERVSSISGISSAVIRRIAAQYHDADGAALYMSTGVNMGPFGSISYWVLQGINILSGNLDKRGGLLVPEGAIDWLTLAQKIVVSDPEVTTSQGWHKVAGCFPVTALPEDILCDNEDRIRALFISAGNPVHSTPHPNWQKAMERLELVVSVDIYINETAARYADYVLPATDMLERSDFPLSHVPLQAVPYAQYTKAVVQPQFDRREEWSIFSDLLLRIGAPMVSDKPLLLLARANAVLQRLPGKFRFTPDHILKLLLFLGKKVSFRQLLAHPEGIKLADHQPGSFLGKRLKKPINFALARVAADLPRLRDYEKHIAAIDSSHQQNTLTLIGRRSRKSHNSWMHNNAHIRQPLSNSAQINSKDAARMGLLSGDRVKISSDHGVIELPLSITADIMPGVIAVPHGWGHQVTRNQQSRQLAGQNINDVIPGGAQCMEPVSGQAILLGHPVAVEKVTQGSIAAS